MEWFRFYSEVLDDPKVQRLPGNLFKSWVNLLCLANKGRHRGVLPPLADIAFALRISEPAAQTLIRQLADYDLIETLPDGQIAPHNWDGRQAASDDAAARKRAQRAKNGQAPDTDPDPSGVCPVTGPVTPASTRPETYPVTRPVLEEDERRKEKEGEESRADDSAPPSAPPKATRSAQKPKATYVPETWEPTDALLGWWQEQHAPVGIDPARETEKWQDYHRIKRTQVTDWAASWRSWMRKAIEFYQPPAPARNGDHHAPTQQRSPDKLTSKLGDIAAYLNADADESPQADRGPSHPNVSLLRPRATA